jgi:uncharacterized membrane protein YphA (DoxX/SURF4 family)
MLSTAREALRAWVARDEPALRLSRFRQAFALIWLSYDVLDLSFSGTAFCADWLGALTLGPPRGLMVVQAGLAACELALLLGFAIPLAALGAVALRAYQAFTYFQLNDFFYYTVIATFLVFSAPEGERGAPARVPSWVRETLVWQTGWIYVATALLKMNPAFLSGGHFLVRHGYLVQAGWPYPAFLRPWLESLAVNQALSVLTVLAELGLGLLLLLGRGRRLAIALVLGIHVFAALAVNVWFFGASMIAQVVLLFPSAPGPRAAPGPIAATPLRPVS